MARAVVVTGIGLAFLTVALWPGGARAQTTDSPNVAAPLAPEPAAAPMEIGLASLQLVVGYVAEIGGGYALAEMGVNHNDLGYHSEYTTLALATALLPALAGGAVGGLGYTSRHYRGRWWATFAGAYAGGIAGALLGMAMAPKPGPDDTESFVRSMTGLIGVVVLTPIGALIGYHAGKQPTSSPSHGDAPRPVALPLDRRVLLSSPSDARHGPLAEPPSRRLLLPVVSIDW